MTIIRLSQHKAGIEEYLEEGKKQGRDLHRDELDVRVPIVGNLASFKAVNQYVQAHKKWTANYLHITISLPWKYHHIPQGVFREITKEVIEHYLHLYQPAQLSAYAEIHYPKQQTSVDQKTGEVKQRLPHVHLIVSKLDLWSGYQLRILPYKLEVERAFQIWLDDNHGFDSHHFKPDSEVELILPNPTEASELINKHKQWHRQYNQPNIEMQTNAPKKFLEKFDWKQNLANEDRSKKLRKALFDEMHLLNCSNAEELANCRNAQQFSAIQSFKSRLEDLQSLADNKTLIEQINGQADLQLILDAANEQYGLDLNSFQLVKLKEVELIKDIRTNRTYSALGLAHELLNMQIDEATNWLESILNYRKEEVFAIAINN